MKFTAVGDVIISRRIHEDYAGNQELAEIIGQGDVRFFNLETTLNKEGECYASQASGGTWLRTDPEVLDDVKKFGFNMTSFNNNHAMDFSFEGLLKTFESVEKSGLVHAGVGRNLAEASAPRYLETSKGRVALISVNTTLMGQMIAGEQTGRMKGRPGINPLRVNQHVELEKEEFSVLQGIIKKTGINAQREIEKREGYHGGANNNGTETIGTVNFVCGETTRVVRRCDERDLMRVKKAIYEASLQADYIIISLHSHEIGATEKEEPADFAKEFARFCIDNGANAVVGHGPHLLRPIEIYKNAPIFYSLGDFVLQLYNIEYAPEDFFEQYGLDSKATVHELLKKRSKDFTIGLMTDKRMFQSVIPYWETEKGQLKKLKLYPIRLSMAGNKSEIGLPRLEKDAEFMSDFAKRCERYGTKLQKNSDGSYECYW
jgi:poly-gamma-glutamate synthesis protein (capsule biosynthesis protein)